MIDRSKYRKYSLLAMILMSVEFLLVMASLWNSVLSAETKHGGWVAAFIILTFLTGVFLFFISFKTTDVLEIERITKSAYESGKNEILAEMERGKQAVIREEKPEDEDIDKSAATVLKALKGSRTETGLCNKVLSALCNEMGFVQGIIYLKESGGERFIPAAEYAFTGKKPRPFMSGENLTGQVAESRSMMVLYDVPESYFAVASALGSSQPRFLLIVPVLSGGECVAVIELAAFKKPDETTGKILTKITDELGNRLNQMVTA
jgi:hypothetical protein